MKQVTVSARIPEELSRQVTDLAKALRRNRSWVIEEALSRYIASERQFIEAVEEGIREMEAGNVVPHAEVVREMDELLAGLRTSP